MPVNEQLRASESVGTSTPGRVNDMVVVDRPACEESDVTGDRRLNLNRLRSPITDVGRLTSRTVSYIERATMGSYRRAHHEYIRILSCDLSTQKLHEALKESSEGIW